MKRMISVGFTVFCTSTAFLPALASGAPAEITAERGDSWQFAAFVYLWYADIGGTTTFPNGQSADVTVDASDLFSNLKFGALGSFEARKGAWGGFADLIYMNVGQANSQYHDLSFNHLPLQGDVSTSTNLDVESLIWTLAGSYRAVDQPDAILTTFAGARTLNTKVSLDWTFNGNVAHFPLPAKSGSLSVKDSYFDSVVGLKGRLAFGQDYKWFIPYYGDIGTGQSKLTWQAMTGIGYAFRWGEMIASYRYMDYQFKSDSPIHSQTFNGPLLGVAFRW